MRFGYLTHVYPYPSHSFIRREILELERRGHEVHRFALRSDRSALVDAADRAEAARTWVAVEQPVRCIVAALSARLLTRPCRVIAAFRAAYALAPTGRRRALRAASYLAGAFAIARELEQRGLRHLHAHFGTHPAAVAHVASVLGGTSYSVTIHGPEEFLPEFHAGLRVKIAAAKFVVAISDYCAERIRAASEVADRERISVVRCAVGDAFIAASTPVDPGTHAITCIGRLTSRKGQLRLLEAAARLKREGVVFTLVLIGDGELRNQIEARIDALDLRDRVEMRGWADEASVTSSMLASRGVIVPSSDEGLPVVIMEALALARPVVASRIAAIPELVREGETGWLVSAEGVDDLADALRALLSASAQHLDELGSCGRALVLQRHDVRIEVERLEALFRGVPST